MGTVLKRPQKTRIWDQKFWSWSPNCWKPWSPINCVYLTKTGWNTKESVSYFDLFYFSHTRAIYTRKHRAIPHLFERLFLISWENSRDCHITMPLSLKTMEVEIKGDHWNKRFRAVQVYWENKTIPDKRQIKTRLGKDASYRRTGVSGCS